MLKNRIASSAIVIAGGLFASGALANTGDKTHSQASQMGQKSQDVSFKQLDQNSDGYISQNEFKQSNQKLVDHGQLDTDNDGRINQTEFAAFEQMSQDQNTQSQNRQSQDRQSQDRWQTDPEYTTDEPFQSTDPTRDPGTSDSDY